MLSINNCLVASNETFYKLQMAQILLLCNVTSRLGQQNELCSSSLKKEKHKNSRLMLNN